MSNLDSTEELKRGVTGDLCEKMVTLARALMEGSPDSIYAHSLWRFSVELAGYFDDDQGIPIEDAHRIDAVMEDALRELLDAHSFDGETLPSMRALSKALRALQQLRETPLSYR